MYCYGLIHEQVALHESYNDITPKSKNEQSKNDSRMHDFYHVFDVFYRESLRNIGFAHGQPHR